MAPERKRRRCKNGGTGRRVLNKVTELQIQEFLRNNKSAKDEEKKKKLLADGKIFWKLADGGGLVLTFTQTGVPVWRLK